LSAKPGGQGADSVAQVAWQGVLTRTCAEKPTKEYLEVGTGATGLDRKLGAGHSAPE
jgi:hypothetical protein